jgi:hypothetical protein
MQIPMQSTLPGYYQSRAAGCPTPSVAEMLTSPATAGLGLLRNPSCTARGYNGLGQAEMAMASGLVVAVGIGLLLASGWLSYQAGKAMAPNVAKQKKWGWIGVPVGMLTGAPGLGIMGWVSNSR